MRKNKGYSCLDCKHYRWQERKADGYEEVLSGVFRPKTKTIPHHCVKHPELFKELWEKNKNKHRGEIEQPKCFERADIDDQFDNLISEGQEILNELKSKE